MNNELNQARIRFSDAIWAKNAKDNLIVVGGQGGIGSWVTLFLSRIGYALLTFDHDLFEEHNMSGQFVDRSAIRMNKANAIKVLCNRFGCDNVIHSFNEKFTNESLGHEFMISAFDNMQARKDMFNAWFEYNKTQGNKNAIFIDGRLELESFQIFCVTPKYTKLYRDEYLFDDSEVEDAACTLKQTTHTAAMIASFMTGFVTNHFANIANGNKARRTPFKTEYHLPLNMFSDV